MKVGSNNMYASVEMHPKRKKKKEDDFQLANMKSDGEQTQIKNEFIPAI